MIIKGFPISTTDQRANETIEGICSVLAQTIRPDLVRPDGTDSVVSEYGIRVGINDLVNTLLQGVNLGNGEPVYKDTTIDYTTNLIKLNIKRLNTNTPNNVLFENDGNGIVIHFNNGQKKYVIVDKFVQGGKEQMFGYFHDDYSQTMPICANMDDDSNFTGNVGDWTTDIALAKTSVLFTKPFNNDGELVWVGTEDTEDYGRLLLEEPLISDYSFFMLEEDGQYSGNRLLL